MSGSPIYFQKDGQNQYEISGIFTSGGRLSSSGGHYNAAIAFDYERYLRIQNWLRQEIVITKNDLVHTLLTEL